MFTTTGYWSLPSGREREAAKREFVNKMETEHRNSAIARERAEAERRKLRQIEWGLEHPHPNDKRLFDADGIAEFVTFDRPFFMRRFDPQRYRYDSESQWAIRAGLATYSPEVPAEIREDYAGRMFVLPCGKSFEYDLNPTYRRMRLEDAIRWYKRHEETNENGSAE